jgi:hypothetical protein
VTWRRNRALPLMAALALAGCSAVYEGKYEPRQLGMPSNSMGTKDRARLAVGVEPAELDGMHVGVPTMVHQLRVHLPLGRIVDGAARASFEREFDVVFPLRPQIPATLRIEIGALRFDVRDDVLSEGRSPLLPPGELTGRMTLEVRVLDANGVERWTGDYDAGRERWTPSPPPTGRMADAEGWGPGLQRLAHEQAVRLTSQAARDIRVWLQSERYRERTL